jgi:hypothetical protein
MNSHDSEWIRWPVAWTAVWVGALTALAVGLLIGLLGFAFGANEVANTVDWKKLRLISAIFAVGGAFFAFVAGGWTAGRIAGIRRSEPAMLHGAIVWLVALPLFLALAALGISGHWGGWYGGLGGITPLASGGHNGPGARGSNPQQCACDGRRPAAGTGWQRDRRLDGFRRADDAYSLSPAR